MANNSVVTQEVLQNTLERYHEDFVYPYQNGATHTGFTPVGTVISYFGETAPEYFLICDGTEYAKSDYPQLADLLLNLTDPTPFEGSDSDHFKVPDLRGEFLRGTGTNGHTNQGNGADVGVHQDATLFPGIQSYNYSATEATITVKLRSNQTGQSNSISNSDSVISNPWYYADSTRMTIKSATGTTVSRYTSRPTNTSVLYCIAYKNIYIDLALDSFPLGISNPTDGQALVWNATEGRWKNAGILHEYSTDEHVVGKWIDGKPLYEITFTGQRFGTITDGSYSAVYYSVDGLNIDFGWTTEALVLIPEGHDAYGKRINCATGISGRVSSNTTYNLPSVPATGNLSFYSSTSGQSNCMTFVTIRYTKTTDTV